MKIGIDYSQVPGNAAGVGQYTRSLVDGLAELSSPHRFELYPVYYNSFHPLYRQLPPPPSENMKLKFRHWPHLPLKVLWKSGRPTRQWLLGKPDVLHITTYSRPDQRYRKLVSTIYDISFVTHPQFHTQGNIDVCTRGTRFAVDHADTIITISEHSKRDLMERFGVPSDRIVVTLLAADARIRPDNDALTQSRLRQRYQLPEHYFLFLGSLEPRKNPQGLLRAYAALPAAIRGTFQLVIAGAPGWKNEHIRPLVKELGIEAQVHFPGYVDQQDLGALYSGAHAFVYPTFYEGFGLPILEAMKCGTPVITTDVASIPEVAGDAALLAPPGDDAALTDAMQRIVEDAALHHALTDKGLTQEKAFSWSRCAARTLDVYQAP